jgi:hypothetical protein
MDPLTRRIGGGKVKPPLPTEQNNRGEGEDGFIGSISVNN